MVAEENRLENCPIQNRPIQWSPPPCPKATITSCTINYIAQLKQDHLAISTCCTPFYNPVCLTIILTRHLSSVPSVANQNLSKESYIIVLMAHNTSTIFPTFPLLPKLSKLPSHSPTSWMNLSNDFELKLILCHYVLFFQHHTQPLSSTIQYFMYPNFLQHCVTTSLPYGPGFKHHRSLSTRH